jgi:hypothetical protein
LSIIVANLKAIEDASSTEQPWNIGLFRKGHGASEYLCPQAERDLVDKSAYQPSTHSSHPL